MTTTTVTLIAPSGVGGLVDCGGGTTFVIGGDGTISVPFQYVSKLLNAGFKFFRTNVVMAKISAPRAADLVRIVAAVTPTNVALTLANQPDQARKLQIRVVIGTTTTTAITAGNLAIVGTDQDGNAVSENVSLIANASETLQSTYAYSQITSATVSGYVASGSGTGNTVGIGQSAYLAIPGGQATGESVVDMTVIKATKIVSTFTGSGTAVTTVTVLPVDDVASTATADSVSRSVSPTTAPGPTSTTAVDYEFTVAFGLAD